MRTLQVIQAQGSAGASAPWLAACLGLTVASLRQHINVLNAGHLTDKAIRSQSARYLLVPVEMEDEPDMPDDFLFALEDYFPLHAT